jgi:hypothetical protein
LLHAASSLLIASAGFFPLKTPFWFQYTIGKRCSPPPFNGLIGRFPALFLLKIPAFTHVSRQFAHVSRRMHLSKAGNINCQGWQSASFQHTKKGEPVLKPIRPWICPNRDGITWRWCSA